MATITYSIESEITTSADLERRCQALAMSLNDVHRTDPKKTLFLCVLPGGYRYFSDLTKYIAFFIKLDFIKIVTDDTSTTFYPLDTIDKEETFERVVIVTDIVNTGNTLVSLIDFCETRYPGAQILPTSIILRQNTVVNNEKLYNLRSLVGVHSDARYVGYGMEDMKTGYLRQHPTIIEFYDKDEHPPT